METTDRGLGRYERVALWTAAILMLVAIALYAWLAGGGPASAPPMVVAGTVHVEPTGAVVAPEAQPSTAPSELDEELPAEPAPTF